MDDNFVASVISIDPIMDAATATFGVRLSLPNPQHRLPPGLKCTLVMIDDHQESPDGADMAPAPLESAAMANPQATAAAEQTVVAHESGIDAAPMTLSPVAAASVQATDASSEPAADTQLKTAATPDTASATTAPSVQAADASSVPATGTQIETTAPPVTTSKVVAPSAQAADAPPAPPAGTQAETAAAPASAPTAVEPPAQVADASPVPPANTAPATLNLRADSCATLGPLRSGPESDEVTARFSASGLGFERRYVGGAKIRVPWLVLSRDTYPAPAKVVERLKQAGVSDFQLLTKGEWRNRVSYGGYVGRKYAQHRLQTMQARGFAAELQRRTRANTKIWLDLAHVFSVPALSSVITGVLNDHPALTVKSIPCTQLASR
jgi:hypothetical protein